MNPLTRLRFGGLRRHAYTAGKLLLLAWAIGLVTAAVQLSDWRQEVSRTLMQLNADAQFRARIKQREAVDPEWYRRKALSLLSATERLRRDTTWTLFMPGSWQVFDDVEERARARIAREFGEIVVETVRRELHARASRLTGVPQVRGAGDLQVGAHCQSPVPENLDRKLSAAAEDLPEFVAARDYVAQVERLDAAVQAYQSLQHASGQPEHLRRLVAYTLNTDLPGDLARSALLFHAPDEVNLQPALMQTRLQWATRCSLEKAMTALHTRLLNTNELFALEQSLAERSAGLFDGSWRAMPFDKTVERYRAVHALLEDQHVLLAKGRNNWMRQASLQLGPGYQEMLERIQRTRLLGPEAVQQLQNQSGAAFAEFRRQFQHAFGSRGDPGIVWLEPDQRFGLSPERAGLRTGLDQLLQASFMKDTAPEPEEPRTGTVTSLAVVTDHARSLANARVRFFSDHLPAFPDDAQLTVSRVVDARVSDLIYQKAARMLKAAPSADTSVPLDPVAFREQRQQVKALQSLLREAGAAPLGERLVAMLDGELLRRLAVIQQDAQHQPLHDARASDFGWWQGEPLPVAQALGASEGASLARLATRLDILGRQAKSMIALGSPALANDPAALRWLRMQGELERYHARHADSSLLRLERYLAGLGPDLRRENCAERLAAQVPQPGSDDDIAQRHVQVHNALARRCNELRAAPPVTAVAQ